MPLGGSERKVAERRELAGSLRGLAVGVPGGPAELALIDDLDGVKAFFARWSERGARVLLAPTLHATPAGLQRIGVRQCCWDVNRLAVEALQEVAVAAPGEVLVAGQIGPYNDPSAGGPLDDPAAIPFDRIYAQYHEQAKPLAVAGPDLVVLRGIDDLRVLRAAIVALRELWSGPVAVVMDGRLHGADRARAARALESLGLLGVGAAGFATAPGRGVEALPLDLIERSPVASSAVELHDLDACRGPGARRTIEGLLAGPVDLVLVSSEPPPVELDLGAAGRGQPESVVTIASATSAMTLPAMTSVPAQGAPTRRDILAVVRESVVSRLAAAGIPDLDRLFPAGDTRTRHVGVLGSGWQRSGEAELALVAARNGIACGLAGVSATPAALERCAKAAAESAFLVFEEADGGLDHECAAYLTRRYGARVVLRPTAVAASPASQPDLEAVVQGVLDALDSAGGAALREGQVWIDLTALLPDLPHDPGSAGLAETLARLGERLGVRWAYTVETPDGQQPAALSRAFDAVDLVILRNDAARPQG